jgi:hypothetical protein
MPHRSTRRLRQPRQSLPRTGKKQTNSLEKVAALGQLDVKQEKAMKATARGDAAAVKKESAEKDAITRKAATAAQDFTKMKDKLARDKTKLRAAKAVGDEALMNVKSVKLSEEMIVKQVEKAKNVNDAMKAGEELKELRGKTTAVQKSYNNKKTSVASLTAQVKATQAKDMAARALEKIKQSELKAFATQGEQNARMKTAQDYARATNKLTVAEKKAEHAKVPYKKAEGEKMAALVTRSVADATLARDERAEYALKKAFE